MVETLWGDIRRAHITRDAQATANGNVLGTTVVDAGLSTLPSFQGQLLKLLDGNAAGQIRPIAVHAAGGTTMTVVDPFRDSAGAVVQVVAGTRYMILSLGGGGGAMGAGTSAEVSATFSHPSGVAEQTIFTFDPAGQRTKVLGIWLDLVNLTQNATIRVKHQIDGTNYRTFTALAWTTAMDDGVYVDEFTINDNIQVSIQSAVAEGVARDIPYLLIYQTVE